MSCAIIVVAIPVCLSWVPAGHMPLPLVAFSCAVSARLLQGSGITLLWIGGVGTPPSYRADIPGPSTHGSLLPMADMVGFDEFMQGAAGNSSTC